MDIKQFINENMENMKHDLAKLVSYNSVNSKDAFPFGKQNQEVLLEALKIMDEKGLKTTNLDYYCGYGEYGTGDKLIGILGHLDIVPAGEGWLTDPFKMTEKDNVLYGRGVTDDKGAVIASLYALKYLIDSGYKFNKRIRLIVGCNEESGSACIKHYVEKCGHIDYGFTPDGDFPGIYGEKGMYMGTLVGHNSKIIDIKGGEASNVVCKKCQVVIPINSFDEDKLTKYLNDKKMEFTIEKQADVTITVFGEAAHASVPDLGKNAFNYLMEALYFSDFNDSFVNFIHQNFALNVHGENLGFEDIKDAYSNTSINLGVMKKENNDIKVSLDMRFPVTRTSKDIAMLLDKINEKENEFILEESEEPLFFDLNTPFIKALKKAYVDVTGDRESKMKVIGGGTYAKAIHNCIAWGCEFNDEDNHIHDANEKMTLDSFAKQVELYVAAIKNLLEI